MNYGEVLSRGLRISWRYRYLWLLSLFGGEYGGGGNFGFSQSTSRSSSKASLQPYADWVHGHIGLLLAVVLGFLLLSLIWFVAGSAASGGLVRAVAELDAGHPFGGRQAWTAGLRTFWPVLGLRLLYLLISLLLGGVLLGPPILLALSHPPGSLLFLILLIPFGLVFIAYAVLADVVFKLALRCLVLELLNAPAAIRSALRLLARQLGRVVLFWLILIAVGIGVGIGLGVVLAVLGFFLLAPISQGFASGNVNLVVGTVALGALLALAVYLVLAALLGTFWSAAWTLAYRRFDLLPGAPPAPSLPGL